MHFRKRHIQRILSKRSKIFPVLGLVGPRQVGKTTFLRQEWKKRLNANYVTLDKHEFIQRAKRAPETFLLTESEELKNKLIIDEVQKVPTLFDSMKSIIDERRRIGIFTVSGSVEFSDKAGVRESLAGRIGVCRLYPLTLAELSHQPLVTSWVKGLKAGSKPRSNHEINHWLKRGGMPIFCALHDDVERGQAIESWLEAICYRDMQQLKGGRFNGDVALIILRQIAQNPRVNIAQLAVEAGVSRTMIVKHLAALETLFLLYRLPSLDNRNATPEYVIFDCAVLRHLGGNLEDSQGQSQLFRTLLINEILAQYEYSGESRPGIFSYRTRGGSEIDLVLQDKKRLMGIELSNKSDITAYSLRGLRSFLASHPGASGVVLAPVTQPHVIDGIKVLPWTRIG
jgi:hypothetical protein